MARYKSPQELMAARNPLNRKAVEPVDIYQPPVPVEAEKLMVTPKPIGSGSKNGQSKSKKPAPQTATSNKNGVLRKYSTYLMPSQIKGIRLRAVEHDMDDYAIVQEAIDEYFQKHPL